MEQQVQKPGSVASLNKLGRKRLSAHFFMRDMLYSEVGNYYGRPNIPDNPDVAIAAGEKLCKGFWSRYTPPSAM